MKARQLQDDEQWAFATAALALRYAPAATGLSAPITAEQLVEPR